jgi:hypothetical protein
VMEKQRTYLQPLSLDEGVEIESQAGSPCFIDPQEQVAQREEVGHIEPTILDVVLATGLVRFLSMRRPGYILPRLLLFGVVLFAYVMLILSYLKGIPLNILLIAIGLCIVLSMVVLWIVGGQRRAMAVRADSLMVQWLGRGRACQGLHALADRSRAPSRRRWGELSLTERIGRVCGTQVQLEQEHLTLVR